MKFSYLDRVKVSKGFYKNYQGKVVGHFFGIWFLIELESKSGNYKLFAMHFPK